MTKPVDPVDPSPKVGEGKSFIERMQRGMKNDDPEIKRQFAEKLEKYVNEGKVLNEQRNEYKKEGSNRPVPSASVAESNKANEVAHELQAVQEEKEVLQREIERLELVVENGTFFQGNDEWQAEDVPYYDIPLSKELQLYTYTRCADLGIAEDYELVLAMM